MYHSKYNLVIIVTILAFIPVLLWFNAPSPLSGFANLRAVLTSFGQISGLMGAVLFAINLILSVRARIFDRYLNGLNDVYLKHNKIGQIALILLLFHPLLLTAKYASNIREAASFLWLSGNPAINFGIIALAMMIFLIVLTLYLMPKYNIWKWTHKFLGLAFFLASLHIWLIPSDVSNYLPLRIYVLGFMALGLSVFVYKSVLGRFLIKKYKYTVVGVNKASNLVTEIKLKAQSEKLMFDPGQFVFLNFTNKKIGFESHPFSLTSSPGDDYISFLIKNLGDYTKKIKDLALGSIAEVEGPFGNFSFKRFAGKSQIWIAGGIGITPFISMAKSLPSDLHYKIDLLYCVRNKEEAVQLNSLEKISESLSESFKVIPFYSQVSGHITLNLIKKLLGDIGGKEIFICAPPGMIRSLKKELVLNGVKKENLHSEEFSF